MSDDRELLEKAAKAAGLILNCYPDEDFFRANHSGLGESWNPKWNPLTDDGDALRLAVKLDIHITPGSADSPYAVAQWWVRPSLTTMDFERVLVEGDRCAAVRRCIVRAAASIGPTP